MKLGKTGHLAECHTEHFGTQTRSAHAQQQNMLKLPLFYFCGKSLQGVEVCKLLVRDRQPAKPVTLVRVAPQGGVFLPQPRDFVAFLPVVQRSVDRHFQFFRQFVGKAVYAHSRTPACFSTAAINCLKASAKSFTPSTTSFSVTSFI